MEKILNKIQENIIVQTIVKILPPLFLILNLASINYLLYHFFNIEFCYLITQFITNHINYFIVLFMSYFCFQKVEYIVLCLILFTFADTHNLLLAVFIPIVMHYTINYFQYPLYQKQFLKSLPQFIENSLKNCFMMLTMICIAYLLSLIHFDISFLNIFDNPFVYAFVIFLNCLLFYYGYHPAFLHALIGPIQVLFLNENLQAALMKQELPHLFTHGTMSSFANLSGTGITIGIVLLAYYSKKLLPDETLKSAWFGVNEPVIFGLPIVRNKEAFVPFVIGGTFLGSFPIILMSLGYINKPLFDAPYLGFFIEAYLTNFDLRSIIVNSVQIIFSLIIWLPFYRKKAKKYEI